MRLTVLIIAIFPMIFGQMVAATPQDDAEFIANRLLSEGDNRTKFVEMISERHILYFTKALEEHSIRVVDADRFTELLPARVIERWLNRAHEVYVEKLVSPDKNDLLRYAALNLDRWAAEVESSGNPSSEETQAGFFVLLTLFGTMISVNGEIIETMPPLMEAPYLADILETEGVFAFPNPIFRRDFIARLRNGG